jgi:hypothetical protein
LGLRLAAAETGQRSSYSNSHSHACTSLLSGIILSVQELQLLHV